MEQSLKGSAASQGLRHQQLKKAKSTKPAGLSTAETAGTPQIPGLRFKVHRAKKEKKQQQEWCSPSHTQAQKVHLQRFL